MQNILYTVIAIISLGFIFITASLPLDLSMAQDASIICVALMLLFSFLPGNSFKLIFYTICSWVIVRYLAWRVYSLPLDVSPIDSFFAILLLTAELYGSAVLLIGFFVNARALNRKVVPLPADKSVLPTIDVYIPTYSEDMSIVLPTLVGATNMEYPDMSKVRIFVLDDGHPRSLKMVENSPEAIALRERSEALKQACSKYGATYITREINDHAKSGNMNNAMKHSRGELILVLDADHVPTTDLLLSTVGGFLTNSNLAFVQTPHFFLNADPVERNLELFNKMPAENDMFYRVVQKGLDLWNTSFFCGSAALIRRAAIEDVGGFAVDSITEDASTSVKMHCKKWDSAYIGKPMICGLQPESFSSFVVQRLRWAMGMTQIFIRQNPIFVKGLSIPQRLSYLSVIAFWLFPFARVTFFVVPILFVFFDLALYPTGWDNFMTYTVPYLMAAILAFDKMFGSVRRFLVSELYETLQAFYTLPALLSTIANPSAPTFKVTPKGEVMDSEFISELRTPFIIVSLITGAAISMALYKIAVHPDTRSSMYLATSWLLFNAVLLGGALGVVIEKAQKRSRPRVDINERISIRGDFGIQDIEVLDANELGFRFKAVEGSPVFGDIVAEIEKAKVRATVLDSRTTYLRRGEHVAIFKDTSVIANKAVNKFVYGKSRRWEEVWNSRDHSSNIIVSLISFALLALSKSVEFLTKSINKTSK